MNNIEDSSSNATHVEYTDAFLTSQAKEVIVMCRVATEAIKEASKAAASILEEVLQHIQWQLLEIVDIGDINFAMSQLMCSTVGIGGAGDEHWMSKAISDGYVLQWCRVEDDHVQFMDCNVDVGGLLFEDAKAQAAAKRIGIAIDKPLEIRIDVQCGSVMINQEQSNHEGKKRVLTAYFLEELVKKHVFMGRHDQTNTNVFVEMLQQAATYLIELNRICAVCGEQKSDDEELSYGERTRCEATFLLRENAVQGNVSEVVAAAII